MIIIYDFNPVDERLGDKMKTSRAMIVVLVLMSIGVLHSHQSSTSSGRKSASKKSCAAVKQAWNNQRLDNVALPDSTISGIACARCQLKCDLIIDSVQAEPVRMSNAQIIIGRTCRKTCRFELLFLHQFILM